MGRVVVLGSLMVDMVARGPRLPAPGESLIGDEFGTFLGGKGCNQAVAAARQGAHVAFIGRVGRDVYGEQFAATLAEEHIDATHLSHDPSIGTGAACILIGAATGQNMIIVTPRANLTLTGAEVTEALTMLLAGAPKSEADIFLAQCETTLDATRAGLSLARRRGLATALNSAPIPRDPIDDATLGLVDILIANETEASALSGIAVASVESAQEAAARLLTRGPRQVVLTLGAMGYVWSAPGEDGPRYLAAPAIAVQAVDATAAGDAFCGALVAGLAQGVGMAQALRRANAAGALTVTRRGALPSLPTAAEVDALIEKVSATPEGRDSA